jgi:hypothetical protein
VQVAIILAIPLLLGGLLGFFELNPVAAEMLSSVGSEAHLLLEPFPDGSLVVEIAYQSTAGPPPASSVSTLLSRIEETCQKNSVTVDEHSFSSLTTNFTDAGLDTLEMNVRHHWPIPGTMALFYLYLDGSYSTADVIGLAYHGSSIAIFEGTIAADAGASAAAVTTTVMVHEFGHELGLVGIVGHAPNEDPSHPYHSANSSDVMYWAVDTTAILDLLSPPSTQFDAADMSDLATVKSTPILTEILPWAVLVAAVTCALLLVVLDVRRRSSRGDQDNPPHAPSP